VARKWHQGRTNCLSLQQVESLWKNCENKEKDRIHGQVFDKIKQNIFTYKVRRQ
jgi:hypothetical protein